MDEQPTRDPDQPQPTGTPPPVVDDYYRQLREGKRNFDSKTADALLMQVAIESGAKDRAQAAGQKHISLLSALVFPWRLFDPAAPSSARRIAVVLVFVIILVIASYMLPSLIS